MTDMQADREDILAYLPFTAATLASLGLWSPGLPIVDIALTDPLWTATAEGYTTEISIAVLVALLSLGWVLWTNDLGFRGLSVLQFYLVIATAWLIVMPPFMPLLNTVLMGSQWAGFIVFSIQSIGFASVGFVG